MLSWGRILGDLLPNAQFPDAVVRRTVAYKMFSAVHIAPSHRRPPHPVWEDSFSLIADLLFGNGMDRYVGAMQGPDFSLEVNVSDYSHWLALNLPHGRIALRVFMPPHSDLSHGSVTNLTLSWSSSLNKQWNTSLHGRRLPRPRWGRGPMGCQR